MKNIFILLLISSFMISCGPKVIYQHKEKINQPWIYGDSISFEYEIVDITKPYNLLLNVSYSTLFSFENMYVNVTTEFPDGQKTSSPVSLQLSDNNGDFQGNCNGEKCELTIEMSSKSYFQKQGKYRISFDQFSRKDSLEGIFSLEMKLEESENK